MLFKEDWEKSKERFEAFWEGEIVDRCCCAVKAPRTVPVDMGMEFRPATGLDQKWLDLDYRYREALYYFSRTFFGGDAFPLFWNNLGPGVGATFMGSGYKLAENTIWFDVDPPVKAWENRPKIRFNPDSDLWKTTWRMTEHFCQNARDQYINGITDIGGNFDIAVSLRGNDVLLYDLVDDPEEVKQLIREIDEHWFEIYDRLQNLINCYEAGSAAWMGLWCPKRWYPLQCDFSAMISAAMFDEFVRPSLQREAGFLDHAIYHLDGPGQIRHLDSLLEIDGITGIQCTPGSALFKNTGEFHPSFFNERWLPVMKKIQERGKNLVLLEVHPSEIDDLMEHLSPKGLFLATDCKTEEEARTILHQVERWGR